MDAELDTRIAIIGAGQAGGSAAEALRKGGHRGAITLIGVEAHAPYERPPLSKAMLTEAEPQAPFLRAEGYWSELDVRLLTGKTAVACDIKTRNITVTGSGQIPFDKLLFATGTVPRRLPLIEQSGLPTFYVRTLEDSAALRAALTPGKRVVLIGGGVIGLEVAASATKLGCKVTVVEALHRLLARALPDAVSDYLVALHGSHGVEFRFDVSVQSANAKGLVLSDGSRLEADLVVVGIGVQPCVELAKAIGAGNDEGIPVDVFGATFIPDVFATGDVAIQFSRWHGRSLRIESWANAQNQSIAVAANMLGQKTEYNAVPWFWSDQYDLNLQVVGDASGHQAGDKVVVRNHVEGRFTTFNLRDGALVGAATVNSPKDMSALRKLVAALAHISPEDLQNPAVDLRRAPQQTPVAAK
jgi:p-cumate 2,3-dioxygenase ferredoxin reductase subunit